MSDWIDRAIATARQQAARAQAELDSLQNAILQGVRAAPSNMPRPQLTLSLAPPQQRSSIWKERKYELALVSVVVLSGVTYLAYRRQRRYRRNQKSGARFNARGGYQYGDDASGAGGHHVHYQDSSSSSGGVISLLRAPFVYVSSTFSEIAAQYGPGLSRFSDGGSNAGHSSSSSSAAAPSAAGASSSAANASSASSSSAAASSPSSDSSLLHRTSRSISIAWDRLAPRFGSRSNSGAVSTSSSFLNLTQALTTPIATATKRFFSFGSPSSQKLSSNKIYRGDTVYVELEFDSSTLPTVLSSSSFRVPQSHITLLTQALSLTGTHLYIGLILPTASISSTAQLSHILCTYYNTIAGLATRQSKEIDFQYTLLLPVLTATDLSADIQGRVAKISDLDLVLFASEGSNQNPNLKAQRLNDIRELREQNGLPNVRDGAIEVSSSSSSSTSFSSSSAFLPTYANVVLGGTFDHLHSGHKILLTVASLISVQSLVIGLTSDVMLLKKKYKEVLEPYHVRLQSLYAFLTLIHPSLHVDIQPLHDMYGPSGDIPNLDALVVSEETREGGKMVNVKRKENGVREVEVVVVELAKSEEMAEAEKTSSTMLRLHEATREERRIEKLRTLWTDLCRARLGLASPTHSDIIQQTFDLFVQRYSEAHRSYHTLAHIEALLKCTVEAIDSLDHPEEVELACWFHDVVYETPSSSAADAPPRTPGQNELESADLFVSFAKQVGLHQNTITRVVRMIHATIKHQIPPSSQQQADENKEQEEDANDLSYFLDFDLSILGANQAVYSRYTSSIRTEYIAYPTEVYLSGRLKVLETFLQRETLYFTHEYRSRLEKRARWNLRSEIQRIKEQQQ